MSLGSPRRGTIVGVRHQSHAAVRAAALTAHSLGDTSFTWSKGPCSSIVTTSSVKAGGGGALGGGSRLGKPGNRRNQHRHLVVADEARLDAHSDSRKRGSGNASEKEGGCGLRPFEESRELRSECPHVGNAVAEVVRGDIWSRIGSRAAPSKRERDASERGPSSA